MSNLDDLTSIDSDNTVKYSDCDDATDGKFSGSVAASSSASNAISLPGSNGMLDLSSLNLSGFPTSTSQPEKIVGTKIRVNIHHGYSFRGLVEYLKETNLKGKFVFSSKGIIYRETNSTNSVFNDVEIFAYELPIYEYTSDQPEWKLKFELSGLREHVQGATKTKKAGIIIVKNPDSNNVYFTIKKRNDIPGSTIYSPINDNLPEVEVDDDIYGPEDQPICSVFVEDFVYICNRMKLTDTAIIMKNPDNTLACIGYDAYNRQQAYFSLSGSDTVGTFSNIVAQSSNSNTRYRISVSNGIKIKTSTLASFIKLSTVAENSCIKFYMGANSQGQTQLKMMAPIQSYGVLRVYLRSDAGL